MYSELSLPGGQPALITCVYLLSPKQLHPQQSEDHDEEEEQEEKADDGLHGVEEGDHQVPQGVPVPERQEEEVTPARPPNSVSHSPRLPVLSMSPSLHMKREMPLLSGGQSKPRLHVPTP